MIHNSEPRTTAALARDAGVEVVLLAMPMVTKHTILQIPLLSGLSMWIAQMAPPESLTRP